VIDFTNGFIPDAINVGAVHVFAGNKSMIWMRGCLRHHSLLVLRFEKQRWE